MKFAFLVVVFLFFSWLAPAQGTDLLFERISTQAGLSHSVVNCILQDREGFLWIGTRDGLNRFDGYNFLHFEHDPQDRNSLSNNTIQCLFEDHQGTLWIGTAGGLNRLNKTNYTFRVFQHEAANPRSLSHNDIRTIHEDRQHTLWIGNYVGLNKYDRQTNAFTLYEHEPGHPDKWAQNLIYAICEDRQGTLWVGTTQGISRFDRGAGRFTRVARPDVPASDIRPQHAVMDLIEDRTGVMWVATYADGLMEFDRKTGRFKAHLPDASHSQSISSSHILALFEDASGTLWIGTQTHGLSRYDRQKGTFTNYSHDPKNARSISHNSVNAIYEDRSGILWVGTYEGGLNKSDLLKKKFAHLSYQAGNVNSIRENDVNALCEDAAGNIWLSNNYGLDKLDRKTGLYTHYDYPQAPENHGDHNANCIYEDQTGRLWIGLKGGGLKMFDRVRQQFTHYPYNPADSTGIPNGNVSTIYQDKQGTLWFGTFFGLARLDEHTQQFMTYKPSEILTRRFSVKEIVEDGKGNLWLAASEYGLYVFDPLKGSFVRQGAKDRALGKQAIHHLYEDRSGLLWICPENGGLLYMDRTKTEFRAVLQPKILRKTIIKRMLEDDKGHLWLSTSKNGLYRFDPRTHTLSAYDAHDGLQGDEFLASALKTRDGVMFFGGKNGLTVFHPDSIHSNPHAPPVAISGFKVFDQPRPFSSEIVLPYRDNFFSFDFVALSYAFPAKNQYAYQLEGVDKDWVQAGTRRYVSYTNLDPGEYVFRVKAANHDGVWNTQGTSLKIIITPPWWRTTWAYLLYAGLFVGLLLALRHYTIAQERLKNNLVISHLESEKLLEMDQMKSRFFTSISHEFRTPLTLILSPLEKNLASPQKGRFGETEVRLMYRNARRLLELINQLLDISKLEAGKVQLETSAGELISFLRANVLSFESLAENKGIRLAFTSQLDTLYTRFDQDKLEKVVVNLLSNAIKFTPAGGEVTVRVWVRPAPESVVATHWLIMEVQDTGIGIQPDQLDKIFDRFYQVDSSHTREFEGTGIGLALAKELVALHHGTIHASSNVGQGTCMTVELPLMEIEVPDFVVGNESPLVLDPSASENGLSESGLADEEAEIPLHAQTPLLLIVEDNADLRTYMRRVFKGKYRIAEATNGQEGLQQALEIIPDLIISDWMMPVMDGVQLCQELKTDERTSHIPLILLTAKMNVQSRLEGLETGADDYITKPFHTEELSIRVKNLIEQRKRLRELWNRQFTQLPTAAPVAEPQQVAPANPLDAKFLQRVTQAIEAHLSDADLRIEQLEKEIGMSHANFNRKLKALTDQSPSEFLRHYRLQRAAQILLQGGNNVSEVAYQVGFTHLSYFTRSFRQLYQLSPSEYVAAHQANTEPKA
jgi:signal transduction histidine kinase/ligand-binding sensor domain-containing protein/DNA-binding response OmpR family regulator